MKRDIIGFSGGAITLVALSLLVFNLAWLLTGKLGGAQAQENLVPFNNVHILEEAYEGTYRIWRDPTFMIATMVIMFLPFFAATFVTMKASRPPVAIAVMLLGFGLQTGLRLDIFRSGYPWSLRVAFVWELAIASLGSFCALKLCRAKISRRRPNTALGRRAVNEEKF